MDQNKELSHQLRALQVHLEEANSLEEEIASSEKRIREGTSDKYFYFSAKPVEEAQHRRDACISENRRKAEYKAELCKRFFSAEEQKYILEAENKNSAFSEIWCKKEAKLKESGLGLKAGLASFSVLENETDLAYGKIAQLHYAVCAGDINKTKIILEEVKLL